MDHTTIQKHHVLLLLLHVVNLYKTLVIIVTHATAAVVLQTRATSSTTAITNALKLEVLSQIMVLMFMSLYQEDLQLLVILMMVQIGGILLNF
jgi:hypothetical protein